MVAWQDALTTTTKDDYTTKSVAVNLWDTIFWGATDSLVRESEAGFDLILSNPDFTYFVSRLEDCPSPFFRLLMQLLSVKDFPYENNVEERGYYWASRATSMYKVFTFAPENLPQNAETALNIQGHPYSVTTPEKPAPVIRGMQGQTWSETIRTDAQYDEMAFPRAVAVAERAWHRADWEIDWSPGVVFDGASTDLVPKGDLASDYNTFASAMGCREMAKLAKLGVACRVPPPGAKVDDSGLLFANTEMPCTKIMYSTNEGLSWMEYTEPVAVGSADVWLQSQSVHDVLSSRVAKVSAKIQDEVATAAEHSQQPKADSPSPDNSNSSSSSSNNNDGGSSQYWGQPTANDYDWNLKPTPSRGFATSVLVPALFGVGFNVFWIAVAM